MIHSEYTPHVQISTNSRDFSTKNNLSVKTWLRREQRRHLSAEPELKITVGTEPRESKVTPLINRKSAFNRLHAGSTHVGNN